MPVHLKILHKKNFLNERGINQVDISKLENRTRNPSLNSLKRLADGRDIVLELKFIPKSKKI